MHSEIRLRLCLSIGVCMLGACPDSMAEPVAMASVALAAQPYTGTGAMPASDNDDCDEYENESSTAPIAVSAPAIKLKENAGTQNASPHALVAMSDKPLKSLQKNAVVVAPGTAKQIWEIDPSDKTLNAAIGRWATVAGWHLIWTFPIDYAVLAQSTIPGAFEDAVETVTKRMRNAGIPVKAVFYHGNKVLRIVAQGES